MKTDAGNYYNNRKKCKCGKMFDLTPVTPCCDIDRKFKQKGEVAFKLHNFLYICKDLLEYTISKMRDDEDARNLQKISRMIERFLEE